MAFNAHNANAMMEEAASLGPGGQADQLCEAENRKEHELKAKPPHGDKLLTDALNAPKQVTGTCGREPVTAVLSAEVKLLVGIVDRDGMPAGPVPIAPQTLARLDPEKRGRSMEEQYRDLAERACAEVLKRWKEENGS